MDHRLVTRHTSHHHTAAASPTCYLPARPVLSHHRTTTATASPATCYLPALLRCRPPGRIVRLNMSRLSALVKPVAEEAPML